MYVFSCICICIHVINVLYIIYSGEDFSDASLSEKFVTYLSNGAEVELLPGGKNIPVSFENRVEYASAVLKTRFNESKKQIEAIKRGNM